MITTRIAVPIVLFVSYLLSHATQAHAQARVADSQPRSVNGLEITVQTAKPSLAADEPITLNVSFRNTSAVAFRAPDRVQPPQTRGWALHAVDKSTGKHFTGVDLRPSGAAYLPGEITPVAIQAGERLSSPVAFQMFGFVEGAYEQGAAKNVFFQRVVARRGTPRGDSITRLTRGGRGSSVPREFFLPAGTYTISVSVQFLAFLDGPTLPADIVAEKARLERDPVPLWKGGVVVTNQVEITITSVAKSLR